MSYTYVRNGKIMYKFVKGDDLGKSNRGAKRLTPRRKCSVIDVKSEDSYDLPSFSESSSCLLSLITCTSVMHAI